MRLYSLKSKINLIFFINIVLLLLLFAIGYQYQKYRAEEEIKNNERSSVHYLYLYYLKYEKIDMDFLVTQNLRTVSKEEERKLSKLFPKNENTIFRTINYDNRRFVFFKSNNSFKIVLEDLNRSDYGFTITLLLFGIIPLLILIYIWIIRSLNPISELKEKIKDFSKGNLDIECGSDKNDEIADLANEFDYAIKMIKGMIRSRQLFLRSTMHELKTPIAKGRLVAEMLDDEKQKERLQRIFIRLNMLIDEFGRIERVSSRNIHLKIEPYPASMLVHASLKILMLGERDDRVTLDIDYSETIDSDIELFPIALKNLIDNAIRYSPDKHVFVSIKNGYIVISNKGKKLPYDIKDYYVPFHHSESSSGLGLYIVKNILDIHKMQLLYSYENGINSFTIKY